MRIAISGKMCSGKTTLKDYLQKKFIQLDRLLSEEDQTGIDKLPISELSFGRPIKEMYNKMFKNNPKKDRIAYQNIGDTFRQMDPTVFANYLVEMIKPNTIVLVDDLRFENEMDILKKYGFICIRLDIDKNIQKSRFETLYPEDNFSYSGIHKSEIDLDNAVFDYTINVNRPNGYGDELDKLWYFIITNYTKDICKIIYNKTAVDDSNNIGLYTPAIDILTEKYVHQSCYWHQNRSDIFSKIKNN